MTKTLVLNCGSSSVKFAIIELETHKTLLSGLVEKLGTANVSLNWQLHSQAKTIHELGLVDHKKSIEIISKMIMEHKKTLLPLSVIGHRVVHGGEAFKDACVVNEQTMLAIKSCENLAPLHNPVNIIGIEAAIKHFPNATQVAVFDTAFHQTLPEKAFLYAVPYQWYQQHKIRRYGFHGTSHQYVTQQAAKLLHLEYKNTAFISLHLGNGCSACAVLNGQSIDTSMGMTPLEGLVMGTRSGDIDPGLFYFLNENLKLTPQEINVILNEKSGLQGISELSSDMRELTKAAELGNKRALLAIEIFCYRLAKTIAALMVPLKKVDALIFTGGIGENSGAIREKTLNHLTYLNFTIDSNHNANHGINNTGIITKNGAAKAMVINTNEELAIASQSYKVYRKNI